MNIWLVLGILCMGNDRYKMLALMLIQDFCILLHVLLVRDVETIAYARINPRCHGRMKYAVRMARERNDF